MNVYIYKREHYERVGNEYKLEFVTIVNVYRSYFFAVDCARSDERSFSENFKDTKITCDKVCYGILHNDVLTYNNGEKLVHFIITEHSV